MELYIHIPFCVKKCDYCDFLSGPANNETKEKYVEALIKEIEASQEYSSKDDKVTSVFVGGGTPSILESEQLTRIFRALNNSFVIDDNAEITVEMNPGTVTEDKFKALKVAGVNRLSIGLQSANDNELKILGRIHTFIDFEDAYKMAKDAGFKNINIDLISAVPGQSVESWANTLRKVASLNPQHISAYSLIIEEGTPFYDKYGEDGCNDQGRNVLELPDEKSERLMYEDTKEILEEYGYHRYEISNYAKDGFECEHNKGYWKCEDYLGLGLGSSSLINGKRFHNTRDIDTYLQNSENSEKIREDETVLTIEEKIEEFMFLGLRMTKGISKSDFKGRFNINIEEVYKVELKKLIEEGFVKEDNDMLYLTERGTDISNQVFVEFMEPVIK